MDCLVGNVNCAQLYVMRNLDEFGCISHKVRTCVTVASFYISVLDRGTNNNQLEK